MWAAAYEHDAVNSSMEHQRALALGAPKDMCYVLDLTTNEKTFGIQQPDLIDLTKEEEQFLQFSQETVCDPYENIETEDEDEDYTPPRNCQPSWPIPKLTRQTAMMEESFHIKGTQELNRDNARVLMSMEISNEELDNYIKQNPNKFWQ